MLFQVVTAEQCCNNMLTILFIVGRITLFTPVDINLEQVEQCCNNMLTILFIVGRATLFTPVDINLEQLNNAVTTC
jgi:predicted membrane protein